MINLFNVNDYLIDTSKFTGIHDGIVESFEQRIADFVGAKYACGISSATNAIFLALLDKSTTITVPSIIPPVVCNAILTSGNKVDFNDNVDWVGDSYILHSFEDYKIVDSAQKIVKNQYKDECNPEDLMIFSFYPTKPIGSYDGGMIVSDDKEKIDWFKLMCKNGTKFNPQSWQREVIRPGYKMYLNAIQAFIANKNLDKLEDKYKKLSLVREKYNLEFSLNNTSNHLYRINVSNREKLLKSAKQLNIELGIHYKSLHSDTIYSVDSGRRYPLSEYDSETTVSLPFNEKLTNEDTDKVVDLINEYELL
tara:strand:- start:1586 stop:2509 length:924 start_codon:yes stop_codon:yes gene_type:complete